MPKHAMQLRALFANQGKCYSMQRSEASATACDDHAHTEGSQTDLLIQQSSEQTGSDQACRLLCARHGMERVAAYASLPNALLPR
jgi:hypothetical protein